MANIIIDVAAEFTGKKAFDQANKATFGLEKSAKKLAGAFGLAFSTKALVNFSKQAVKAFAQDEVAAVRLTRAVENLGIGFANPAITKFVAGLEKSAAIADDILRPAFQALLTTTGSLTQSQKLLNDAITISRASGIDLATVSQDLANGYVGITRGLKKYNTGLTTAELTSKSFAEVLGVMLTRSAGAATDYLETTQFKMDTLTIATGNASEILGEGLVNAFAAIGGGTEASDAAAAIESIATAMANVTSAAGKTIGAIPTLLSNLKKLGKDIFLGFAGAQVGVKLTPAPKTPPPPPSEIKQAKLLAKLESDAVKRQKALLALQKKQSDRAKKAAADQAKLSKAQSIFDLDKIQIEAALKGKISEEEKTRLLLMQAIAEEDVKKAEALEKKLEDIQEKNAKIAKSLGEIPPASDPFAAWVDTLADVTARLAAIDQIKLGAKLIEIQTRDSGYTAPVPVVISTSPNIFSPTDTPSVIADKAANAAVDAAAAASAAAASVIESQAVVEALAQAATNGIPAISGTGSSSIFNPYAVTPGSSAGFGIQAPPVTVNVTNTGSVIMQEEFVKVVADALVIANTNGQNTNRPGSLIVTN